jgi:hypothetical protein
VAHIAVQPQTYPQELPLPFLNFLQTVKTASAPSRNAERRLRSPFYRKSTQGRRRRMSEARRRATKKHYEGCGLWLRTAWRHCVHSRPRRCQWRSWCRHAVLLRLARRCCCHPLLPVDRRQQEASCGAAVLLSGRSRPRAWEPRQAATGSSSGRWSRGRKASRPVSSSSGSSDPPPREGRDAIRAHLRYQYNIDL